MKRKEQEPTTKATRCYEAMRLAIAKMEIQPGERLRAEEWAERLDSSVIPVREALAKLDEEGLVEIRPYSGARVTEINLAMVPEIFHFGEEFNALGARLACLRLNAEDILKLREIVELMEIHLEDPGRWGEHNGAFHGLISRRCGMEMSLKLESRFAGHWARISQKYCQSVSTEFYKQVHPDHILIVDAIEEKDAPHAEYLMRRHVKRVHQACYKEFEKAGVIDQVLDPESSRLLLEEDTDDPGPVGLLGRQLSLG